MAHDITMSNCHTATKQKNLLKIQTCWILGWAEISLQMWQHYAALCDSFDGHLKDGERHVRYGHILVTYLYNVDFRVFPDLVRSGQKQLQPFHYSFLHEYFRFETHFLYFMIFPLKKLFITLPYTHIFCNIANWYYFRANTAHHKKTKIVFLKTLFFKWVASRCFDFEINIHISMNYTNDSASECIPSHYTQA